MIALVSMLFEYFFEDGQLAPLMKHLLARMQITIIKVAILDSTFFENSLHPARMLVNKMARAASGWQPNEELENDQLYKGMEEIVFRLNDEFVDDLSIFDELLLVFDELKRSYEAAREKELEALRLSEERALAEIESQDRAKLFLTQILDEVQLPDDVAMMLKQDWYRLMRLILLKQGESQNWRNSARIGKELVWSLQPGVPVSAQERFELIVPKMLNGLEDGLRAIGKSDEFILKLLVTIAKSHEKNKHESEIAEMNEALDRDIARLETQMHNADQLIAGPMPLLVDEPEVNLVPADINFYLAMTEQLNEGMWFNFAKSENDVVRICLTMIVADGAKYVFTDSHGQKSIERSGLGVALALRENKLIQLDDDELVDRTLKTVAENMADQNPVFA